VSEAAATFFDMEIRPIMREFEALNEWLRMRNISSCVRLRLRAS